MILRPCLPLLCMALVALMSASTPVRAHKAIIVVRHAEKASASDPDSPLSLAGQDRAMALARLLRASGVQAVFVTDKKRTQQTAEPIASQRSIVPTVVPAGDTTALLQKLKAVPKDAVVLVVGHSNTVPDILTGLGAKERVALRDDQYGRVFAVLDGGRVLELSY